MLNASHSEQPTHASCQGVCFTPEAGVTVAVIDAGIHRSADGIIGDIDFVAVSRIASKINPVPGGVGPMTIAELLCNTLKGAQLRN